MCKYRLPGAAYSDLQEGTNPKGVLEDSNLFIYQARGV